MRESFENNELQGFLEGFVTGEEGSLEKAVEPEARVDNSPIAAAGKILESSPEGVSADAAVLPVDSGAAEPVIGEIVQADVVEAAPEISQPQQALTEEFNGWGEMEQQLRATVPELTQADLTKVAHYIAYRMLYEAPYRHGVSSKRGKLEQTVEALQDLGILDRLRAAAASKRNAVAQTPDAGLVGKRVSAPSGKPMFTRSQIAKMSQAQFNKIPDEMLDAMLGGENIIDDL